GVRIVLSGFWSVSMSSDDLANCVFAYVLIGALIWALVVSIGGLEKAFAHSKASALLVSAGTIFGWPVIVGVFISGMVHGARSRRAR
ncbi:hypothetical protein, partial [Pseudomonas proteolytica]|uniref:hypothetical protein n=2 Tax=Pseudomonas proteolytica TaxID=219574 RepID=UPI0030DA696D